MNEVPRWLQACALAIAILTGFSGGLVAVDSRYAKATEVRQQLQDYYIKSLQLRILEIDLKPNPTAADKALRQYLQQEIDKSNK